MTWLPRPGHPPTAPRTTSLRPDAAAGARDATEGAAGDGRGRAAHDSLRQRPRLRGKRPPRSGDGSGRAAHDQPAARGRGCAASDHRAAGDGRGRAAHDQPAAGRGHGRAGTRPACGRSRPQVRGKQPICACGRRIGRGRELAPSARRLTRARRAADRLIGRGSSLGTAVGAQRVGGARQTLARRYQDGAPPVILASWTAAARPTRGPPPSPLRARLARDRIGGRPPAAGAPSSQRSPSPPRSAPPPVVAWRPARRAGWWDVRGGRGGDRALARRRAGSPARRSRPASRTGALMIAAGLAWTGPRSSTRPTGPAPRSARRCGPRSCCTSCSRSRAGGCPTARSGSSWRRAISP